MSNKFKKVLSVLSTILIVFIVCIALATTVMSIRAKSNGNIPTLFNRTVFTIQTDSMEDTIKVGDLIIGKKVEPDTLKEGDIISFKSFTADGQLFINTHRIVGIDYIDGVRYFQTKGDNLDQPDLRKVADGDIVSLYTGTRLAGMGKVLDFLNTQLGFFFVIVFPVLLYTIWQVVKLVQVITNNQKVKLLEETGISQDSEEYKQKVIAEYLAKQKESQNDDKNNQNDKSDTE